MNEQEQYKKEDEGIAILPLYPHQTSLLKMKVKLGIAEADTTYDTLLQMAFYDSLEEAKDYCNYSDNDVVTDGFLRVVVDIACERYRNANFVSSEASLQVSSIKRGDVSTTFTQVATFAITDYKEQLKKYRKLRWD